VEERKFCIIAESYNRTHANTHLLPFCIWVEPDAETLGVDALQVLHCTHQIINSVVLTTTEHAEVRFG
jgi:hypothetical protein